MTFFLRIGTPADVRPSMTQCDASEMRGNESQPMTMCTFNKLTAMWEN